MADVVAVDVNAAAGAVAGDAARHAADSGASTVVRGASAAADADAVDAAEVFVTAATTAATDGDGARPRREWGTNSTAGGSCGVVPR